MVRLISSAVKRLMTRLLPSSSQMQTFNIDKPLVVVAGCTGTGKSDLGTG